MSRPSEAALHAAAAVLAQARRDRDTKPIPEAARDAWHPGGPAIPELEALIRAQRPAAA